MTDEIYTDPLGRKYRVFKGSDFNKMFGGLGGKEWDEDAKIYLPYNEPDDKLEFPDTPRFDDIYFYSVSGKVSHDVNRRRAYGPHRPPKLIETAEGYRVEGEKGFTATDLDIFAEIDWFGECCP